MEMTINTSEDLGKINLLFRSSKRTRVNLSSLSPEENELFSEKLNIGLNACGCETGKYFAIYSLIGGIVLAFLKYPPFDGSFLARFLMIILIMFLSGIAGKFLGILIAKIRIIKVIRQIKHLVELV